MIQEFQEVVWGYYHRYRRELPWRSEPFDPYRILVSEIMLQQTQAPRVIPKYHSFLDRFPDIQSLAKAGLGDVLREWSGLGYNRRAKYLHEAAKMLAAKPQPWRQADLEACKGIGKNTAAAVMVYAYDQPHIFIETNIRTVFIRHFFDDRDDVADKEILPLVQLALDEEHPREFYYALMDYGVFLKKTIGNTARRSKHYAKQSKFAGSNRQIRGQVLRLLSQRPYSHAELMETIIDERLELVLAKLRSEGLIRAKGKIYQL